LAAPAAVAHVVPGISEDEFAESNPLLIVFYRRFQKKTALFSHVRSVPDVRKICARRAQAALLFWVGGVGRVWGMEAQLFTKDSH
jgi:hypothetical protein